MMKNEKRYRSKRQKAAPTAAPFASWYDTWCCSYRCSWAPALRRKWDFTLVDEFSIRRLLWNSRVTDGVESRNFSLISNVQGASVLRWNFAKRKQIRTPSARTVNASFNSIPILHYVRIRGKGLKDSCILIEQSRMTDSSIRWWRVIPNFTARWFLSRHD